MGIERFFNSLKDDFKITEPINPDSKNIIKSDYLFLDFNSIIHVVSQRVNNIVDMIVKQSLLDFNGCGDGNSMDHFNFFNLDSKKLLDIDIPEKNFSDYDSEDEVLSACKTYFTIEKLDDIIINNVGLFILNLIKKFDTNLKILYISIDGVPSKAKMVEQKKRRFMGEFESFAIKEIVNKYKKELNVEKKNNCNIPFNKYKYLTNKIVWSRGAISPATSFMLKLSRFLDSIEFKNKINEINNNLTRGNIIISNFTEKDEGEKKIIDYINQNEIDGTICIFSPDADLILLTMILKNKNLKKIVLRNDQQKSDKIINTIDSYYDITDINKLEDIILEYFDNENLNRTKVINDIVFIFTIFGDDFLHKIDSFDVRNDINLILDIYKNFIKDENYILSNEEVIQIKYKNFKMFLEILSKYESNLIKRNYMNKKYKNFNYLSIEIISKTKIKENELIDFINKNNTNYEIDKFKSNIIDLIKKFIIVDVIPKRLFPGTITFINVKLVPLDHFIKFIERIYDNNNDYSKLKNGSIKYNKDIYRFLLDKNKFTNIKKVLLELIDVDKINKKLFSSKNIQTEYLNKKYIKINNKSTNNYLIKLLIIYFYLFNELPITKYEIPYYDGKFINLIERKYSYESLPNNKKEFIENNFDKEKILFENMIDEYYYKLNKNYDLPLGNPNYSFEEGKKKYYNDFFKDIDMTIVMKMYIDGLQWILDYYYNGITYQKWYYIYNKSPLIQDLISYLNEVNDENIFNNSKKALKKCCYLSITDQLTPLEQLIYITPFNKEDQKLKMFYSFNKKIYEKLNLLIGSMINSEEFSDLYPDIKSITEKIINSDSNNEIDCRSAIFLNKCILNVVNNSNLIDETKFKINFRKQISVEEQNLIFSKNKIGGGINNLFNDYKKLKKLFFKYGDLKYKKKYQRLKYFISEYY